MFTCVSSVHAGNKGEKTFANSIGMKLVRIEPGMFVMGMESTPLPDKLAPRPRFKNGDYDEKPRHKVTISQPFYISETEVTIEQYRKFKADFPGFKARLDHHPYASGISWYDAVAFCKWLSDKEGKPYRLPTEAEWEYACRARTQTPFSSGDTRPEPETANPWGLKNMHTGVLEWCPDWHGLYPETPQTDPIGPEYGWTKVVRGGGLDVLDRQTMSFYFGRDMEASAPGDSPYYARSANRAAAPPSFAPPPREYQAKQMECINPPLPPGPQLPSPYRAKGMVGGWHNIGFRVVQAAMPDTKPTRFEPPFFQRCVKQTTVAVSKGPDMMKPYYRTRRILLGLTKEEMVNVGWKIGVPPGLGTNHHNGAVVALPNGDLLAVYYNGFVERDPDLSIGIVRLRYGSNRWDVPSVWPDFLDGNDASPFIFVDGGVIWLGWGGIHLAGGYPFQWTTSKDNGATWSAIRFPIFESRPGGYGRRQPINAGFRGPDNTLYVAFDGWGSTSGLWATRNNGQTWFDTGGRILGLHATFVLLDDNSILAYGTRNRTIDGFCPKNVSTDWGKTWRVSRSPMPGQGGGRNPIMIKLASGRLLYVTNMGKNRDPNVKGFTGGGAYAGLSSDNGQTWRIRKLLGGQTRDENGKPIEVRTVGYVGAAQSQNGIIHLVTSRNNPDLHIELNEAWILADDGAAKHATPQDDVKIIPGTVKVHQEYYPNDKLKVSWRAGTGEDGRYLLHGSEIWRYQNGQRQWEVSYHAGRKVGAETYWNPDGTKKWQRSHREDGTSVWTVYRPDGKLKAESHWRDKKLLSHSIPKSAKLDIKVDFGLPVWSGPDNERGSDEPVPGTVKQGWTSWVSPRWADMYDHGAVQLENVAGTGVSMLLSTVRGGHMTLKVCGMISALAGGLPPSGSPVHEPICNSWIYNCDWPDNPWGDIILAIYNLPAGEYVLNSYHNHFNCSRVDGTDEPTLIDCSEAANPQPAMPSITALSLAELLKRYDGTVRWHNAKPEFVSARPEYWDYHGQADFPPKGPLGPIGSGAVETVQAAHNVQPQQVTRDKDLVPSVMKFRTDGSAVHIVYEAGCCTHDNVRPSRDGGRAILNAFELKLVDKIKKSEK
jgi:hypothetical protein